MRTNGCRCIRLRIFNRMRNRGITALKLNLSIEMHSHIINSWNKNHIRLLKLAIIRINTSCMQSDFNSWCVLKRLEDTMIVGRRRGS